jgi:hypothetical protein
MPKIETRVDLQEVKDAIGVPFEIELGDAV